MREHGERDVAVPGVVGRTWDWSSLAVWKHHSSPGARPPAGPLTRWALFALTIVAVLLGGQPGPAKKAALDRAVMAAYRYARITSDPRTWVPRTLARDPSRRAARRRR